MSIPQIVFTVIAFILVAIIAIFTFSYRSMYKNADKFFAVGTVEYCASGKLPMTCEAVIQYTKSGKPYQASTGLIPSWKKPKVGSKGMYTIYYIRAGGKKLIRAKRTNGKSQSKKKVA